jgi:hypothetical protein
LLLSVQALPAREYVANGPILVCKYDCIRVLFLFLVVGTEAADESRRGKVALLCIDVLIGGGATEW